MYPRTGTTSSIFVGRDPQSPPQAVQPAQDYFLAKIYAAQAAFRGSIWDRVKGLVITSQVNLNHRNLGSQGLRAIQRTREVRKNEAQPLGLSPNLIHLVPAVMPSVSIGIAFVLDKENQLVKLSGLINSDSFFSTLSLAAGPAAVAKTVADCFKFRNKIGIDVAVEALKDFTRRHRGGAGDLARFARICRVNRVMRPYLDAIS